MPVFNTMTKAAQYISLRRERRQIWCIASLEGARYYVFLSQPNLGGYTYNHATKMLTVNDEILKRTSTHDEARARANKLKNLLLNEARNREIIQHERHAEEIFLEQWADCVSNFRQLRGRAPKTVDLFLSHTPCTIEDNSPSLRRLIHNRIYPPSCTNKLKWFVINNPSIKLRVYYINKFGTNASLDEHRIKRFYRENRLVINKMDRRIVELLSNT